MVVSEEIVGVLHKIYARILWFERGGIDKYDLHRMNCDWLDARRIVGYKLADEVIKECESGSCHPIPDHYFSYLSAISLNEFKAIKAYLMWEARYEGVDVPEATTESIYLESCEEIEHSKVNCECESDQDIPIHISDFLMDSQRVPYHNIIKRKAYWSSLSEENPDPDYHWRKAEKFVDTVYKPLASGGGLRQDHVVDIILIIDENHHLTNMFEYCIRCHLLRNVGLNRLQSGDGRAALVRCAQTGLAIKKGTN